MKTTCSPAEVVRRMADAVGVACALTEYCGGVNDSIEDRIGMETYKLDVEL